MDSKVVNIIAELDQYIASGESRLGTILKALDWTTEDSLKESTCSTSNRDKEFNRNDPRLPDTFGWKNSVVIDKPQLQEILMKKKVPIPEKFSDIQLNFTREQKAKLYDHVIANTTKTSEPELKVSFPSDDTDNTMTFAEIVAKAKKKDKKLQRKYRTSKPTHIEEVRNLVHLQMAALDKYFNPEPESQITSFKRREINSQRSRCRDNYDSVVQKSRNRITDKTIQNKLSASRNRNNQNRRSDKRGDTRSRSRERSNQLLDRKSPSVEKRKHSKDGRNRKKDKDSLDRIKKKKKRNKSSKSKKKHKHHRKHLTNK